MKTLKTILSVFAIAAVFSAGAYAQETANVEVSANAVASLSLTTSSEIELGTIQTGIASTIKANTNDPNTEANVGTSASPGQVDITGASGADITVDFTNATVSDGNEDLTFTTSVQYDDRDNDDATLSSGDTITISDGAGTGSSADTEATLYLGGTLAAPSNTGTYNTTLGGGSEITVTVTYN